MEKVGGTVRPPGFEFPEGTVKHKNSHYYLIKEQLTYSQAEEKCKKLGGNLLVINDKYEYSFIKKFGRKTRLGGLIWIKKLDSNSKEFKLLDLIGNKQLGINCISISPQTGKVNLGCQENNARPAICEWNF